MGNPPQGAWAAFRGQLSIVLAALIGGASLGLAVRGIVVLAHDARTAWWPAAAIGALVGVAGALTWRHARSLLLRVRISRVTLRLGGTGADVSLDPDSREQLWRFFIQMASRVATRPLALGDGVLEEALNSLYSLFDTARSDLSSRPPRGPIPAGTVPPHIYVLDILNADICALARRAGTSVSWNGNALAGPSRSGHCASCAARISRELASASSSAPGSWAKH
jgi:hypothetical protein